MKAPKEIPLAGGYVTPGIVRVGATVRRPTGPHSPFVHELLRYLEEIGFDAAPRFLGIDEQGREILTFIEGMAPRCDGTQPLSDEQLVQAAVLIHRLHEATAGSHLAGNAEIVGHNELGPHNTIFSGERPVAFIDWDEAAPGTRLSDLAYAVWCFVDIGEQGGSVTAQAKRLRLMCDTYGWSDIEAIVDWIAADLRGALANHERAGRHQALPIFRAMVQWMDAHAAALKTLA
ncbi:MAG TPA: phosphotransferase [Chloroflexota bacterium]|nr:phosphotransferase [Chloroflexota bacterium]